MMWIWNKRKSHILLVGIKWYSYFGKTVWWFLLKLNIYLPDEPTISLLGIYQREMKTPWLPKKLHMNAYSNFINNHKKTETIEMSFSWLMDK